MEREWNGECSNKIEQLQSLVKNSTGTGERVEQRESALWDPLGVFFTYLTYEIGISDYKGMNLGWMNLG